MSAVTERVVAGAGDDSWARDTWADQAECVLVCRRVTDITHDVKSFLFEPLNGGSARFEAGQFLTLRLDLEGTEVERCYTIASPPTRPYLVEITVKRVPGGTVSPWLHDTITPGTTVRALAPLGSFTIAGAPVQRYLFLSGGSGITPLMSMTRYLHDTGSEADVVFVHSARTPADIIFRDELDALTRTAAHLRVVHICEDDDPGDAWTGPLGRLSAPVLQAIAPDLHQREVFTCGPAPYMSAVQGLLSDLGFDLNRYHQESFDFSSLAADPVESQSRTTFTVNFARSGRSFACAADQNVLDAALAAGLRPASSCGQGLCGTCKTTLLEGDVDMRPNGGIRPKEIAQGKVLICCSTPRSDLTVDS